MTKEDAIDLLTEIAAKVIEAKVKLGDRSAVVRLALEDAQRALLSARVGVTMLDEEDEEPFSVPFAGED